MLFLTGAARASLIVTAESVTASAGSSGDSFDLTLTNTGPSAVRIGDFSFGLSTSSTHVTFTAATTSTTTAFYIFDGLSLFGPTISTTPPGQSLQASDVFSVPGSGTTIGAGVTLGLGHVLFNVDSSAPSGPIPVTLSPFPQTSLSDQNEGNVPLDVLVSGTITVPGRSTVPEPSTLLLGALGGALLLACSMRERQPTPP
jgi:hypothetical protein